MRYSNKQNRNRLIYFLVFYDASPRFSSGLRIYYDVFSFPTARLEYENPRSFSSHLIFLTKEREIHSSDKFLISISWRLSNFFLYKKTHHFNEWGDRNQIPTRKTNKKQERANRFECLISQMMMMILGMGDLSAKIKIATLIFYSRRSLISLSFSLQTGVHDVLGNRRRETTTTRGCWDSWSSHFSYPPPHNVD